MSGSEDRDALSDDDRYRFDAMILLYIDGMEQEYQLAQEGIMSSSHWEARKRRFRGIFVQPGMVSWWTQWQHLYNNGFRESVDGLLREGEAAG